MNNPISRPAHRLTDYSDIPCVAAAPSVIGFTEEKSASRLCRAMSGLILASSGFTLSEWG